MDEKEETKKNKLGDELGEELRGLVEDLGKDEEIPGRKGSSSAEGGNGGILGGNGLIDKQGPMETEGASAKEIPVEIPEISSDKLEEPEVEKKLDSTKNATIYQTKKGDQPYYRVSMPDLSGREREIMTNVREKAIDEIDIDPRNIGNIREREEIFSNRVIEMLRNDPDLSETPEKKLIGMSKIIVRDMIGFGMLDMFLED
ncbi:MAG: hypothetical protein ACLFUR_03105, partial [Candidatus Hadarchaeia archaeon]